LQTPALLLLALATKVSDETCERMVDYLLGNEAVSIHQNDQVVRSPLRDFYLSPHAQQTTPGLLYDTVSHLTVLRTRLREYQGTQEKTLTLANLIDFVNMYDEAEQRMPSTNPYNQQSDAVQLMTVFKAKGLEFEHVFLPSIQDEVWGGSARRGGNKLTLPANLAPIRHDGTTDDERLRILFVAITRAKYGLHLTDYRHTYSGKQTKRLQYLDEQEQEEGVFKSLVLPPHSQSVIAHDEDAPGLESLELSWQQRHLAGIADPTLHELLQDRLKRYQLSPTHLTRFIDLIYGGPEAVFLQTILCFPSAPSLSSQFGDAIHETLEWVQHRTNELGHAPATSAAITHFTSRLQKCQFTDEQRGIEQERGAKALRAYLKQNYNQFKPGDKAEQRFTNEGVFIGKAHLSGKIDRLEIDHHTKTILIGDYKTGNNHLRWSRDASLHKYRLQLYLYRALVEGSHSFKGYRVTGAYLDFVEPDKDGRIHRLNLQFDEAEYARVRRLAETIWHRITTLDLPDITAYTPDLAGIEAFESKLLDDSAS
jgi:ATP-dependent exoDNAse (exonuclease V) beta subunit